MNFFETSAWLHNIMWIPTCNKYFCWPFWCSFQDQIFYGHHVPCMCFGHHVKHLTKNIKKATTTKRSTEIINLKLIRSSWCDISKMHLDIVCPWGLMMYVTVCKEHFQQVKESVSASEYFCFARSLPLLSP